MTKMHTAPGGVRCIQSPGERKTVLSSLVRAQITSYVESIVMVEP